MKKVGNPCFRMFNNKLILYVYLKKLKRLLNIYFKNDAKEPLVRLWQEENSNYSGR
jgi:hypothetical protein